MWQKTAVLIVILCGCLTSAAYAQLPAPPIGGSGTPNFVPKFTGPKSIGNTSITEFTNGCLSESATGDLGVASTLCLSAPGPAPGVIARVAVPNTAALIGEQASADGVDSVGVLGVANSFERGIGVRGQAANPDAAGGIAILGEASCPNCDAGVFNAAGGGNILVGIGFNAFTAFRVDANGNVFANSYNVGGADFAESFAVAGERDGYEPGDLLVIDSTGKRRLALATEAYSTLVAGIYSTKPGIVASPYRMDDPNLAKEIPLAIVGVVPCKVSAENGAIQAGDLLVASSTPGHAMKGTDRNRMMGAVVGKALEPLAEGRGVIQILVTLQ